MTRVDFYHLQTTSLDQVLPKLCEKAYQTGMHIHLFLGTEERIDFINSLLWTYAEESFLPHGCHKDGFSEDQPIYISADKENKNSAKLLILADGAQIDIEDINQYNRVLNVFDGNDETSLNKARSYWNAIQQMGGELHYWQQNIQGVFEQKK
jgi:DNA polymerase-3 subunit chi